MRENLARFGTKTFKNLLRKVIVLPKSIKFTALRKDHQKAFGFAVISLILIYGASALFAGPVRLEYDLRDLRVGDLKIVPRNNFSFTKDEKSASVVVDFYSQGPSNGEIEVLRDKRSTWMPPFYEYGNEIVLRVVGDGYADKETPHLYKLNCNLRGLKAGTYNLKIADAHNKVVGSTRFVFP